MNYEDRDTYGMYKVRETVRPGPGTVRGPGPSLMGADTLVGNSVIDSHGDDLGDIKEIMLDVRAGRISYAVLSFGGFLGMGKKLFAVPWQALKLDTENKCMVRVHRPAWRGALTGGLAIALGLALVPAKAEDSSMTSEAKSDMHRSERVMSDSWITTKVKSELLANSISDGTNVSVKTTHGVVVLTGTLASQDAVSGAKRIAEHVKGVKRVDSSGLTVGPR